MKYLLYLFIGLSVLVVACEPDEESFELVECQEVDGRLICEGLSAEETAAKTYCRYEQLGSSGKNCVDKTICIPCKSSADCTIKRTITVNGCTYKLKRVDKSCITCPDEGLRVK